MRDNSGMPLWLDVMVGTAGGVIIGGIVLYALWSYNERRGMEQVIRSMRAPATAPNVATPPNRPVAERQDLTQRQPPCQPPATLGDINGRLVCVAPDGSTTTPR